MSVTLAPIFLAAAFTTAVRFVVSSMVQRAALKTGMDRKSAAKYREGKMPRERRTPRTWRTRLDPLAAVWPQLQAELERAPDLQALTLLTWLQERYPGQYGNELLRTLQRRVRQWRALKGPAKEVFFRQVHEPGRLGSSDFTHMNDLAVTIHEALWHRGRGDQSVQRP